jgi:arsenite methyltransferase
MEVNKKINCTINRPGSFEITDHAISLCSFQEKASILDIGCGSGATVDHLTEKYGFQTSGIDKNSETHCGKKNLITAFAENIPYPDRSMDGIIMECSFSLVDEQEKVMNECHRVLKNNGILIISDMYARGETANFSGCLGRLESKENIIKIIENAGFAIKQFEDLSHQLQTMWGQMILEKGSRQFYCELGANPEILKKVKCGYCLIIASKITT